SKRAYREPASLAKQSGEIAARWRDITKLNQEAKMTVIVKKIGGSVAVVIPKAVASEMGLSEGTSLDLRATADAIVMRNRGRRKRRPIERVVSQIKPSSYGRRRAEGWDTDAPIGKEVW